MHKHNLVPTDVKLLYNNYSSRVLETKVYASICRSMKIFGEHFNYSRYFLRKIKVFIAVEARRKKNLNIRTLSKCRFIFIFKQLKNIKLTPR